MSQLNWDIHWRSTTIIPRMAISIPYLESQGRKEPVLPKRMILSTSRWFYTNMVSSTAGQELSLMRRAHLGSCLSMRASISGWLILGETDTLEITNIWILANLMMTLGPHTGIFRSTIWPSMTNHLSGLTSLRRQIKSNSHTLDTRRERHSSLQHSARTLTSSGQR